ncbi:MAG: hypothetical protein OXG81_13880 [Acidobacteria bacterium]|nr:hypothetical protein [Acidobacteriota bacterium]MCY3972172.1 hypothetical protein [Acidobacteriota bacterium]
MKPGADCRLMTDWTGIRSAGPTWHRWRTRALVATLAEALIETDRDRLVVLLAYPVSTAKRRTRREPPHRSDSH